MECAHSGVCSVDTATKWVFSNRRPRHNTPMPLPGGPSGTAGNRYEARWTVACMAPVLSGELDSIRLEPPGLEGQGVEFCDGRGDSRCYHQAGSQDAEDVHAKIGINRQCPSGVGRCRVFQYVNPETAAAIATGRLNEMNTELLPISRPRSCLSSSTFAA